MMKKHEHTHAIDTKKRNTLKVLGGTAVIAATPAAVTATCLHGNYPTDASQTTTQATTQQPIVAVTSAGTELTIALTVDSEPKIRLTNHSKELIIVRHVYPGIIHAGKHAFDINSIFEGGAYAISPGTSREAFVRPTVHTAAEVNFPRHLYRNQPLRVAAVTGRDQRGVLANSTRSFFS